MAGPTISGNPVRVIGRPKKVKGSDLTELNLVPQVNPNKVTTIGDWGSRQWAWTYRSRQRVCGVVTPHHFCRLLVSRLRGMGGTR